jgi:Tol biopolymer transport system component
MFPGTFRILLLTAFFCSVSVAFAQNLTVRDIMREPHLAGMRPESQRLSPDGDWVAYTVATPRIDTNETETNLWLVDTKHGRTVQITGSGKDRAPRWAPDGKSIAFLSRR